MCMDTSQGKRLEQAKRINDSFARIPEKKNKQREIKCTQTKVSNTERRKSAVVKV